MTNPLDYPLCANSPFIRDQQYLDFEHQSEQLNHCDQRYYQLTSGNFKGRFITVEPGSRISFHVEFANQRLQQFVGFPDNTVSIGLVLSHDQPFIANGMGFGYDDILICRPGAEMNLVSPKAGAVMAISLDQQAIQTFSDDLYTRLFARQAGKITVVEATELANSLRRDAFASITLIKKLNTTTTAANAETIESATLNSILGQLDLHLSMPTDLSDKRTSPGYFNYRQALQPLMGAEHKPIDYRQLTTATGLSRRSLQLAFANVLQLSPTQYSRIVRLNLARRTLQQNPHSKRSIGDVAAQLGFDSWSRFTQHYTHHFNEHPSATRKRISSNS
jgi:AraC family ethanolamine operon transcriptional activator